MFIVVSIRVLRDQLFAVEFEVIVQFVAVTAESMNVATAPPARQYARSLRIM